MILKPEPFTPIVMYALLIISLVVSACNDSDSDSPTDSEECEPQLPSGDGPNGSFCMEMEDCLSGYCLSYSHAPLDPNGICAASPDIVGDIHITGTVTDFFTNEPITGQSVALGGALDVLQNPDGFTPIQTILSDEEGKIDALLTGESTQVPIGLVAVVQAEGYYRTSTGLVEPEIGCDLYPPGIRNRDIKMISDDDRLRLSQLLEADFPELADALPLGDEAGVIGKIKHVVSGYGVAGAIMRSRNTDSQAQVFYLNDGEDHFNTTQSGASGLFVIINPGMAEKFDAIINDQVISRIEATVGQTRNLLYSTTVHVEGLE